MNAPLKDVDLKVFSRLAELTTGGSADVEFHQLLSGYTDGAPSIDEVVRSLKRLRETHHVTVRTLYGLGSEGTAVVDARQQEHEQDAPGEPGA